MSAVSQNLAEGVSQPDIVLTSSCCQTKNLAEFCTFLVEDTYGELAAV